MSSTILTTDTRLEICILAIGKSPSCEPSENGDSTGAWLAHVGRIAQMRTIDTAMADLLHQRLINATFGLVMHRVKKEALCQEQTLRAKLVPIATLFTTPSTAAKKLQAVTQLRSLNAQVWQHAQMCTHLQDLYGAMCLGGVPTSRDGIKSLVMIGDAAPRAWEQFQKDVLYDF